MDSGSAPPYPCNMHEVPTAPLVPLARRLVGTEENVGDSGVYRRTRIDGFGVVEARAKTPLVATLYRPVVCLIVQGAKEVELAVGRVVCTAGQSIIVSHDLPIQSRITVASPAVPYLALILDVDVTLLRRLVDEVDGINGVDSRAVGDVPPRTVALDVGTADEALIDAFGRLVTLAEAPLEAQVLAPLVVKEIHFRLLLA